jgi:UDP-glucuronate decarboxylase
MKNSTTCIVTGGAGFIGSHLCEALLSRGYTVYSLDNLLTGSRANITLLESNPNFHFINHDVTLPLPQTFLSEIKTVRYVYHLASPASPPQYRKYAIETLLVNSVGTYNMLNLSRGKEASFLLASTSEVYGDPLVHPQNELYYGNVNSVGLRACYDEAKRFAEAITMEFYRKHKVHTRIVRIFNTYGPRMQPDDGRVVSNFITQAISDKPLTVYGDGTQTRSFCFVSDMVRGLIAACEEKDTDGSVINLGNPNEQTIIDIAKLVIKLTQSKGKIIYVDRRLGDDPQRRKPDIRKANKLLGWNPEVNLTKGLLETISYFRKI